MMSHTDQMRLWAQRHYRTPARHKVGPRADVSSARVTGRPNDVIPTVFYRGASTLMSRPPDTKRSRPRVTRTLMRNATDRKIILTRYGRMVRKGVDEL